MQEAAATGRVPGPLLDRGRERRRLAEALASAAGGQGSLLAIEGEPGIGKTRLLDLTVELAGDGATVLRARATELERDFAWGVASQLFEHRVLSAPGPERERLLAGAAALALPALGRGPDVARFPAEAHGLYWLVANFTAEQPLVLLVDDLQWADAPSARWLRYLAPRLDGLPALVVVSARAAAGAEVSRVLSEAAAEVLRPTPLGTEAARALIASRLRSDPEEPFALACHAATGGNPFLLEELARQLAAGAVEPTAANASLLPGLEAPSIARAILGRLDSMPSAARALARAVAVLAPVSVGTAGIVAGLDAHDARAGAELLVAEGVLRDSGRLEFVHPVVARATATEMPAAELAFIHARAARLLDQRGEDTQRVALHLVRSEPNEDPWVVARLREAATTALSRGAPEVAATQLRRALAEPPLPEERVPVLTELARAAALAGWSDATQLLRRALEASSAPPVRTALAVDLARASALVDRDIDGAAALLERERHALADIDPALALRLDTEWIGLTRYAPHTAPRAIARLDSLRAAADGAEPATRVALAQLAMESAFAGDSAARTAELAVTALADGALVSEQSADSPACYLAIHALVAAGRLADAEWHLQVALADARRRGSAFGFASASMCRSHLLLARGSVTDAVADGRAALDLARENEWWPMVPWVAGFLVNALQERDDIQEAAAVLGATELTPWLGSAAGLDPLLEARGRLRLARSEHELALADFRRVGELRGVMRAGNPAISPWRSRAALCLAALGRGDEAATLVTEELSLARAYDAGPAIGVALRAAALITGGEQGLALLLEAVDGLGRSSARLEHARALVDLGAALRRAGRRRDARAPLNEGLAEARRLGALALARTAHDELGATGLKPRRMLAGGAEALTPSEHRVADLAAQGLSNAQIAQALFVTLKTVESHLGRAYRKLDITGREGLPQALEHD